MAKKTSSKKGENHWEDWGEDFGHKIEAKFSKGPMRIRKKLSIGGLLFGVFLLSWGLVWLGNDLKLWDVVFPFWPIIIILLSVGIIVSATKRFM